jgi:hypothetical protein
MPLVPNSVPESPGFKTGTAEFNEEYANTFRRRLAQIRLRKQALPEEETLRQVRKLRRRSQLLVAQLMHRTQSDIAKLEKREDALVSTLSAYVRALGGTLDLVARFRELHVRIRLGPAARNDEGLVGGYGERPETKSPSL